MLLAPAEDTRQYSFMYSIGSLLLQRALTRLGWERPEKLFAQLHSDFAKSARDAAAIAFPGALLVNDLEHMFRNLRRHQSENTRLRNVKVGLVIRFVGFSAFLPNVAIFSTFWQYRFKDLERMGEGAFVQYFQ